MIIEFEEVSRELRTLIEDWEPRLQTMSEQVISMRRNKQGRTIREIIGHMVDSATNNTHRVIHLQYQSTPYRYPDYANLGNNDRWITIQHYQQADWHELVQLWKYLNLHYAHIIRFVDPDKLDNEWISALETRISLKDGIIDYLQHFRMHLEEIRELIAAD